MKLSACADWLQSVHVVSTGRRVANRVSVYTVPARVMVSADAVIVCPDITVITAIDVCSVPAVTNTTYTSRSDLVMFSLYRPNRLPAGVGALHAEIQFLATQWAKK